MRPIPSTCPWTKCPPNRPSARSGRSRFTRVPAENRPSVVTRNVSGPTSAKKSEPSSNVTVRQTPFTATLTPNVNSVVSGEEMRSRAPPLVVCRSTTSPVDSTRPVNIAFRHHIRSERFLAPFDQIARGKLPAVQKFHSPWSKRSRRRIESDVIDDVFGPGCVVHAGATLQQQRGDAAIAERSQARPDRSVCADDRRSSIFERSPKVIAGGRFSDRQDHDRPSLDCREDASLSRCSQVTVENHANQRQLA